jgi:molybdopterin-containing oxidoreductase family iron-sulfur binding subunit
MSIDRRRFCGLAGLGVLGIAAARGASGQTDSIPGPRLPAAEPLLGERWALAIDVRRCREHENCRDCIKACHETHNVPTITDPKNEVKWIWKEHFEHVFPEQHHDFMPASLHEEEVLALCNHCDRPPCTKVCPTQATWKREDGVVMMDWHRCIGCRYCIAACPYGARSFNWLDPRNAMNAADITPEFPTRTRGVVEKCNLCEERLALGQRPACVEACSNGCMFFGDLADPNSEVRRLLEERPAIRRKPALGTQPQVYYFL